MDLVEKEVAKFNGFYARWFDGMMQKLSSFDTVETQISS